MKGNELPSELTLRRLSCFVAVSEAGSYAAAADRMQMTAPAVWRQVKQLEDDLGLTLVSPGQKGTRTRLTEAGKEILVPARKMIRTGRALFAAAENATARPANALAVAGYPAHSALFIAEVVARLRREHIAARIGRSEDNDRRDTAEQLLEDLASGVFDLVVAPPRPYDSVHLVHDELYRWELVAVTDFSTKLAGKGPIQVRDLAAVPILVSPESHESHRMLFDLAQKSLVELQVEHETESVETMLAMARQGLGVPVLPADALASFPDITEPRSLQAPDGDVASQSFYFYCRRDDENDTRLVRAKMLARDVLRSTRQKGVHLVNVDTSDSR